MTIPTTGMSSSTPSVGAGMIGARLCCVVLRVTRVDVPLLDVEGNVGRCERGERKMTILLRLRSPWTSLHVVCRYSSPKKESISK